MSKYDQRLESDRDEWESYHLSFEQTIDGAWMVLFNGFQWGPSTSTPDASGAYPDTWPTLEDAKRAWYEQD